MILVRPVLAETGRPWASVCEPDWGKKASRAARNKTRTSGCWEVVQRQRAKYAVFRVAALCAWFSLSACHSSREGERMSTSAVKVEVLGFGSCPNTPRLLRLVENAAESMVPRIDIVSIDQETLETDDLKRGYPAPTVLVNGQSFFGDELPESPSLGCRSFPDGLPTVEELTKFFEHARKIDS